MCCKLSNAQRFLFYLMEYLFLLVLGGCTYYGIELLWRGFSHDSMFFVGGLCFITIGIINEKILKWETPLWIQVILGDVFVLIIEFVSGVIINIILKINVWDYSALPFNVLGQICLPFAILWLPVVLFAIVVDDWTKFILFNGPRPHYVLK